MVLVIHSLKLETHSDTPEDGELLRVMKSASRVYYEECEYITSSNEFGTSCNELQRVRIFFEHVQKFGTRSRLQAELCRVVPSYAERCRVVASYPELHKELYASYCEYLI